MSLRHYGIVLLVVMFSLALFSLSEIHAVTGNESQQEAYDIGYDSGKTNRDCFRTANYEDGPSDSIGAANTILQQVENPFSIMERIQFNAWEDGFFAGCSDRYNEAYGQSLYQSGLVKGRHGACHNIGIDDGKSLTPPRSGRIAVEQLESTTDHQTPWFNSLLSEQKVLYGEGFKDGCIEMYMIGYDIGEEQAQLSEKEEKDVELVRDVAEQLGIDEEGIREQLGDEFIKETYEKECIIATASFGSPMAKEVQMLREIRDNQLLKTQSGSAFMGGFNTVYYSFAPTVAQWEQENPMFKETVKIAITPLISSLSILNHVDMDSEAEVLGYGISLILLNIGMYFGIPIAGIYLVKFRR